MASANEEGHLPTGASDPQNADSGTVVVGSVTVSGPLPPPSVLAGYNEQVENGAERVMRMAEAAHVHGMEVERVELAAARRDRTTGLWMGFVLLTLFFGGSLFALATGQPAVAIAFVGASVVGAIGRFVTRRATGTDDQR